jgi:hypothetical protein
MRRDQKRFFSRALGPALLREMETYPDMPSLQRRLRTLSIAELDALMRAFDDSMGTEWLSAYNRAHTGAVLSDDAQQLWDEAVAKCAARTRRVVLFEHNNQKPRQLH